MLSFSKTSSVRTTELISSLPSARRRTDLLCRSLPGCGSRCRQNADPVDNAEGRILRPSAEVGHAVCGHAVADPVLFRPDDWRSGGEAYERSFRRQGRRVQRCRGRLWDSAPADFDSIFFRTVKFLIKLFLIVLLLKTGLHRNKSAEMVVSDSDSTDLSLTAGAVGPRMSCRCEEALPRSKISVNFFCFFSPVARPRRIENHTSVNLAGFWPHVDVGVRNVQRSAVPFHHPHHVLRIDVHQHIYNAEQPFHNRIISYQPSRGRSALFNDISHLSTALSGLGGRCRSTSPSSRRL